MKKLLLTTIFLTLTGIQAYAQASLETDVDIFEYLQNQDVIRSFGGPCNESQLPAVAKETIADYLCEGFELGVKILTPKNEDSAHQVSEYQYYFVRGSNLK